MPLVRIEIVKNHSTEYKKTLLQTVHDALMSSLGIPDWDRFQRLYELDEEFFERSESKTDKFTIIEITMFPGRSKEMKNQVITQITEMLGKNLDIKPEDIFIIIHEPPLENWGMAGKQKGND